jgi:hypothetical protein
LQALCHLENTLKIAWIQYILCGLLGYSIYFADCLDKYCMSMVRKKEDTRFIWATGNLYSLSDAHFSLCSHSFSLSIFRQSLLDSNQCPTPPSTGSLVSV